MMVRKRHCNISGTSLADVFTQQPEPPSGPLGLGAPGFTRSEPIVVMPQVLLHRTAQKHVECLGHIMSLSPIDFALSNNLLRSCAPSQKLIFTLMNF